MVNIGKSVIIKGELSGSEDLTIEGQVEGKIELRQNVLTIGPNGKIKAQVFAKAIVVQGEVHGNVTATERVDIRDNGSVDGDLSAPRVAIADGAHFRGASTCSARAVPRSGRTASRQPMASRRLRQTGQGRSARREALGACPRRRPPAWRPPGRGRSSRNPQGGPRCRACFHGARGSVRSRSRRRSPRRLPRDDRDVEGPAEVPGGARAPRFARPARSRPGDRRQCRVLRRSAGAAGFTSRTCSSTSRRRRAAARAEGLWQAISARLSPLTPASFDGILCWDVFDYLDRPTGQALAARLAEPAAARRRAVRLLRDDGDRPARTTRASSSRIRTRSASGAYPATPVRAERARDARHHPDVRPLAVDRIGPAQDRHPRDAVPKTWRPVTALYRRRGLATCGTLGRSHGPAHHCPADRLRHPRPLRRAS